MPHIHVAMSCVGEERPESVWTLGRAGCVMGESVLWH